MTALDAIGLAAATAAVTAEINRYWQDDTVQAGHGLVAEKAVRAYLDAYPIERRQGEFVEEAAKRMVDAWCYAPRGTPDWNAEWARKRSQYLKQASAVLSTTPATFFDRIEARLAKEAMVRKLWQELLEKDDRTSPADYPDMALITFEEFRAALEASLSTAPSGDGVPGMVLVPREGGQ